MVFTESSQQFRHQKSIKWSSGIVRLVVLRVCSIFLIYVSMILSILCVIFRPWKWESTNGKNFLEYSIWTACRITSKGGKCYDDLFADVIEDWFLVVRYFFLMSIVVLFLALTVVIWVLLKTQNSERRHVWISGFFCMSAACLQLMAMITFSYYYPFDFGDPIRFQKMGWTEETQADDGVGYAYYIAWSAVACSAIAAILLFILDRKDRVFSIQSGRKPNTAPGNYFNGQAR